MKLPGAKLVIDRPVLRQDLRRWCHFGADTLENLHEAARVIGLRREWFQDKPGRPHYDIYSQRLISRAVQLGALVVSSKEFVQYMKIWYEPHCPE